MAWSFNPFTGNLDLTGSSGAVVFEGEVETFADLPEVVGDPPVGSSYLVRTSTGVWLVNKRQSGIWIRRNNTGVRATDWEYGGDYPVNSVNGQSGNVVLSASDVGAPPTSRTITAGAGLTGGGDFSANRTLAVSFGTTAGTACEGNDGRISGIESGSTTISSATVGIGNAGISIDTSDGKGELHTGDGGSISTNDGGGSIDTSNGGGAINTRGTGSIEFGISGTRTTLTGTATADRAVSLPNAAGTLALTSDITKTAVGLGNVANVDTTNAANISSGVLPNARVNWAAPSAIGSTTAAAGTFTTLTANNGTLTASAPVLDLSQTWNNAAVTFTGLRFDVTNTASATTSRLVHLTIGGTSNAVGIYRDASGFAATPRFEIGSAGVTWNIRTRTGGGVGCNFDSIVGLGSSLQFLSSQSTTTGGDVILYRDAADTLALGRSTNPQTFRLYNTFTDASNYERAKIAWSSNVLQIGTEKGSSGGSARALDFQTDGTTRFSISSTAAVLNVGGGAFDAVIGRPNAGVVGFARADGATTYIASLGFDGTNRAFVLNSAAFIGWSTGNPTAVGGDLRMYRSGAGVLLIQADTSTFDRLQFGGTTSLFPALKRSSTTLQVRLADDTAYSVLDAQLRAQGTAPATSGAAGTAGDIRYDADYIYVCTAANTWKRAAIATW